MRKGALLLLALFCFASAAHAAGEAIRVPLSKVSIGNISIEYVCRRDGIVGPFVNTEHVTVTVPDAVSLFSNFDLVRSATFFDKEDDPGRIAFPDGWTYVPDASLHGFFIHASALSEPGRSFPETVKALTGHFQLYFLQIAASKFVGVRMGGQKFVAEIDLSALSADAISECLAHAGHAAALSVLKAGAEMSLRPAELQSTCLALNSFYNGLKAAAQGMPAPVCAHMMPFVRHPVPVRADCFHTEKLSHPALARAALEAASLPARLDYAALAFSSRQRPLPDATYVVLQAEWEAGDLPSIARAEKERQKTQQLIRLKFAYRLYTRILACVQGFRDTRAQVFASSELSAFRRRLDWLEGRYRDEMDTGILWDEVMADYPAMLSSTKSSIAIEADAAFSGCTYSAGRFRLLAVRLVDAAVLSEASDFRPDP